MRSVTTLLAFALLALSSACSRTPESDASAEPRSSALPAATPATLPAPMAPGAAEIAPAVASVTVYKSPTCGCCTAWEDHLRKNGFTVTSVATNDMDPIKKKYGVAPEYQSCHTAIIGDYIVEGHVPATDIKRMLAERPKIRGISAPGMPRGSPGMEGPFRDAYEVVTLEQNGTSKLYARH